MRKRASEVFPPLHEPQVIAKIVDNANDRYHVLLVARAHFSLDELVRYAEHLVQSQPSTISYSRHQSRNRAPTKSRSIYAIETEPESGEDANCNDASGESQDGDEAGLEAFVEALTKVVQRFGFKKKSNDRAAARKSSESLQAHPSTATTPATQNNSTFSCYGCNTPGVIKKNCIKCNADLSKNAMATP